MNENFRFKDLPYVRPDFAKVKTELAAITEKNEERGFLRRSESRLF
mgnify:CR=1 FL=1